MIITVESFTLFSQLAKHLVLFLVFTLRKWLASESVLTMLRLAPWRWGFFTKLRQKHLSIKLWLVYDYLNL
jgi:hypothetical protein